MAMIRDDFTRAGYDAAREYLIRSPIATYYFLCVECKEIPNIYLKLREPYTVSAGAKFEWEKSTIWWSPGFGYLWKQGAASPALVLLHEIIHACRYYMLGTEPSDAEEIFAVDACNQVAQLVGEDFRPLGHLGTVFVATWNGVTHSDQIDLASSFDIWRNDKRLIKTWMRPEWIRRLKGKPRWGILDNYPDK